MWPATAGLRHKVEPELVLADLAGLIRVFAPALDYQLGPYLGRFLIDGADYFAQAGGLGIEWRLYHLHQNPIVIDNNGDPRGYARALPEHRQQFNDYLRSIAPVDPGGAPTRFQSRDELIAAVLGVCERFNWIGDQAPTLERLASAMCFADVRGLRKHLQRHGVSWTHDLLPRLRR